MARKKTAPKPVEAQAAEDMAKASQLTEKDLQDQEAAEMTKEVQSRLLNVVVVKTGPGYRAEYPNKMLSMLKRHLQAPFKLHCLTDDAADLNPEIAVIRPDVILPGWWNKLYVFSGLMPQGPLLYLDLDQILLNDITGIVEECQKYPFACYADHIHWQGVKLGTAWMQFEGHSLLNIFEGFWNSRRKVMYDYQSGGDQVYLGPLLQDVFYWDEVFPGAVASYKFDLKKGNPKPENKLVNCHGNPKPHQITDDWVKEHWQ